MPVQGAGIVVVVVAVAVVLYGSKLVKPVKSAATHTKHAIVKTVTLGKRK